jgi:hypothetical protein
MRLLMSLFGAHEKWRNVRFRDAEPAIAVIDQQRSRTGDRLVSINRAHANAYPSGAASLSFAPPAASNTDRGEHFG